MEENGSKGRARINLALTAENAAYITEYAAIKGESVTGCINGIIEQYRKEHQEAFRKAQELHRQARDIL